MWHSVVTWLLGIERGEIARGTGVRLEFANPWPTWLILLFGVGAVWLVAFLYRHEKGTATRRRKVVLATFRCIILAIVLVVLFKPILAVDKSELKQAYVVFLLDDSLSMKKDDSYRDTEHRLGLAKVAGLARPDQTELSASQSVQLDGWTRADLVNRVLASPELDLLGHLEGECKLYVATFADSVRGLGPDAWQVEKPGDIPALVQPHGTRTLLGAAMREAADGLRGHRIAAMVVVTDGRSHDTSPSAIEAAAGLGTLHGEPFPVLTVGVGTVDESKDIEVVKILGPTAAKKDDQVTFHAVVTSRGFEGNVDVVVERDGQLLRTLNVPLRDRPEPQTFPIPYTPDTKGSFRFRVSIAVEPDEQRTDNNEATHDLEVKDAKTKVLFVAGQPSYFYRYLKNALIVDQSVTLSCFLQSADADFHQEGNVRITHYPEDRKELFEYDVVVFSDVDPAVFRPEQLDDLRAFVGKFGGGFVLVAGASYPVEVWTGSPVEELLPVALGGSTPSADPLANRTLKEAFQPRLTEQGRLHGIMRLGDSREESLGVWGNFPGAFWYQPVARAKPGAVVLAEHPYDRDERGAMPLIVVGRYDPGRTLFCALDSTWRWRFWVGDPYFNRFWVQAINYVGAYRILGSSRRIQLAGDKRTYALGERVVIQAQCLDDSFRPSEDEAIEAKVELRGAPTETVRLVRSRGAEGIFEGTFLPERDGTGTITVALGQEQDSMPFEVKLPDSETKDSTLDEDTLRRIAEATHGEYFPLHEVGELKGRIQAAGQEITSEIQETIFDSPLVVILFLGFICSEWWFRKRGMLA